MRSDRGGTSYLQLNVEDEAVFFKMWVMIYHTIQDHIPDDSKLQIMNSFQYHFINETQVHFIPVREDENICVINYYQLEITAHNATYPAHNDEHTVVIYVMGSFMGDSNIMYNMLV
jgi:hypothetical protein